jgi:hypothetical protein
VKISPHVFFFRGLSTYGHDDAKWSVFNFGPMYKNIARELKARDVQFHAVTGMGAGPVQEVAARAHNYLKNHPVWNDPQVPVHFLAHSAGGLVARYLMNQVPSGKVASLMTIASPHQGARLAQICLDMPELYRGSARLLRTFGYDIASRRHFFTELTNDAVSRLFATEKKSQARTASIVCHAPRREWCAPLKLFYKVKAFNDFDLPSDGVVERDTQAFGEVVAELKIDHFRQCGFFGEPRRFQQLCDVTADFFKTS